MKKTQTWFELDQKLAEGGMGAVYLAKHVQSGKKVAVKLIKPDQGDGVERADWLLAEVQATARLHHQNVIGILDYGVLSDALDGFEAGSPFFAMELLDGGSISENSPTSWRELKAILGDCLQALAHGHARDVIHRDIKPANILRRLTPKGVEYVLTDFGIAHAAERHTSTHGLDQTSGSHEDAAGTPFYMAPEQFMGLWRTYGPWTDLYSLGIVAWELSTGKPPFRASNVVMVGVMHMKHALPAFAPQFEVPAGLAAWVAKMTAKEPHKRFVCAADAYDALMSLENEHASSRDCDGWEQVNRRYRTETVVGGGFGLFGLRHVPIEGRERIRDRLWSQISASRAEVRVSVLRGEVGLGKSRLGEWIHHLSREVGSSHSFKVSVGAEFGVTGGLVGLVNSVFRSHGLVGVSLQERMEEWLVERGEHDFEPRLLADFADMGSDGGHAPVEQVFSSILALLRIVAVDRPVQIWFDDLDRGEIEQKFVGWLLEEETPLPVHIVATGISSFESVEWLHTDACWVADVSPLTDSSIEQILQKHVHLPPGVSGRVVEYAAGSPLFALQLLDDWMDRGLIRNDGGRAALQVSDDILPRDIEVLWRRRIDKCASGTASADATKMNLEVASLIGEVVETRVLEAICDELGVPYVANLRETMIESRLAIPTDTGFAFGHRLLRESLLVAARSREDFAAMHGACARVIGRFYQAGHPQIALRVADHLSQAGQWHAALVAAKHAASQSRLGFDVGALRMCADAWKRCLDGMGVANDSPQRIDLWTMRSYTFLLDAAPENREKGFDLLRRAASALNKKSRASRQARYAARAGIAALYGYMPLDLAYVALQKVLSNPSLDAATLYECEIAAARVCGALADTDSMLQHATVAWGVAETPLETMQALQVLARCQLERGDLESATSAVDQATQIADRLNLVVAQARCLETSAFIADAQDEFDLAAEAHRKAVKLFELAVPRTSYPYIQREYLGRALLAGGHYQAAYDELQQVHKSYQLGKASFHTSFHEALVAACLGVGRISEAKKWLGPACDFEGCRTHELHWRALAIGTTLARRASVPEIEDRLAETLVDLIADEAAQKLLQTVEKRMTN